MKHLLLPFSLLICLFLGAQIAQAQFEEKFDVTVKGSIDNQKGLKSYDNIRIGVLWHSDDINPKSSNKWNVATATGKINSKGKFKFTLTKAPPQASCIVTPRFALAIGFIIAFEDKNKNQKFDNGEQIIGLSEKHAMSFVRGSYQKGLNALEKRIKKRIITLRKLKNGIMLNKVVPPELHKLPNARFDDLEPVKKRKVKIKVVIPKKMDDLDAPNWT